MSFHFTKLQAMRNILTAVTLLLFCSCTAETAEKGEENKVSSQEIVDQETPKISEETDQLEVLLNDNYPEDWEKIKNAILSKDESEIGIHCAIVGVNKPKLIEASHQDYVLQVLKESTFTDLIPDQKGDKVYLKLYIENPANPSENLSIFLNQGPHLFIEYFIDAK